MSLSLTVEHSEHQANPAPVLLALEAGCREQPPPGTALSISGNIFSAFPINITSSTAASSDGEDKPVLTTGATVGIALGAAALFLGAIALFVVYCLKQKKYEREDKAPPHPYGQAQHFYYKDPGSGPASITTDHSYVLPQYTVDYKPSVSVSETPEPLPSDYSSNAEYYDRLEGKTRGGPLRAMSPPAQQPQPAVKHEQVDTIGQLPTTSLPTHPAYIPRTSSRNSNSRGTPPPAARPSRNATPASVRSSTQTSSSQRPQHSSTSTANSGGAAKPDSYAIQVYLNAAEDPKVPQPPPPVAAPSWSSSYPAPGRATPASNAEIARNIQVELAGARVTPPASAASMPQGGSFGGRATPAPSLQHISRTTSPDHTTDGLGEGSPLPPPPRIGSLILPSVPRIRVPGSRKMPPRLEVPDDVGAGAGAGISGPLAFPGSRFSTRPPAPGAAHGPAQGQDRIIEQMVDRGGRSVEVPIGSGKSYLYG